jgi:dipeptidyl aminopeptidase/acylaminoacyl peptidase
VSAVRVVDGALVAALLLGALGRCGSAAADTPSGAAPPAAAAFGALPAETDTVLSPGGTRLAWVDHAHDKPRVVMFDVDARRQLRVLALPERLKLRSLMWNDDDTLLVTFSQTHQSDDATQTSREFFINIAYGAAGGDGRMLPAANGKARGAEAAAYAYLVRGSIDKPHTVIMGTNSACYGGSACLLEVDTATGTPTIIKTGKELTVAWEVDRAGTPVARADWDYVNRVYRVYALSGNNIRQILETEDKSAPRLAGILPDDSALVLLATNGRAHQAAWKLPLDGSPTTVLAEDPDADIDGTYTDPYTGAIIGVYVGGSKTTIHWLDAQAQQRAAAVRRAFPNRQVSVYGWSVDGARTLAKVETPSTPPVYYLIDFKSRRAYIAGEEYPGLEGATLGEFREITYKARDGTPIPAYLTLPPPGKHAGPGPLVVLPHGGPQARDYPAFDWLAQFLATRGYAVLQPQFRGSSGFGEAFERAGYRQWGGLMQDDVTDGVRAMIDQGIADAHHVCIVGASYGGYAALAGAAFTPDLYACAASVNGVSDLRELRRTQVPTVVGSAFRVRRVISTAESVWTERIGSETDPALATKSPINSVASIKIPVMIAYGTGDGVVPTEQSLRMAEALQKAGKTVTVVKLPYEDHWLSQAATRTAMLEALDSFLKQHL